MSTTIGTLFLDELKERAVRDIEKLTPGTEILIGHVPDLSHPELVDSHAHYSSDAGIVTEVGYKYFDELHPGMDRHEGEEPKLVILYSDGGDRMRYMHATDAGVLPYGDPQNGHYNDANFMVLISELNDEGIMPLLRASDDYEERLKEFNSKVHVYDYSADIPWGDEY